MLLGKVGFLVIDLTWKLFIQTGNVEAYLLLKDLENDSSANSVIPTRNENEEAAPFETKM